jgi:hypothetical protein
MPSQKLNGKLEKGRDEREWTERPEKNFLKIREPFPVASVLAAVCSLCEVISHARARDGHLDFFVRSPLFTCPSRQLASITVYVLVWPS